jgi:hypothetical protein
VLFRLAYFGATNTRALLRLLPMSDRDKDAEILARVGLEFLLPGQHPTLADVLHAVTQPWFRMLRVSLPAKPTVLDPCRRRRGEAGPPCLHPDAAVVAAHRTRWTMRWKPVLNAFAITFGDRWPAAETY